MKKPIERNVHNIVVQTKYLDSKSEEDYVVLYG